MNLFGRLDVGFLLLKTMSYWQGSLSSLERFILKADATSNLF